jgi:hypothetical protein
MDFESEIKKLKSHHLRIIFLLEEILYRLDKTHTNGLAEKIRLFQLKLKDENMIP